MIKSARVSICQLLYSLCYTDWLQYMTHWWQNRLWPSARRTAVSLLANVFLLSRIQRKQDGCTQGQALWQEWHKKLGNCTSESLVNLWIEFCPGSKQKQYCLLAASISGRWRAKSFRFGKRQKKWNSEQVFELLMNNEPFQLHSRLSFGSQYGLEIWSSQFTYQKAWSNAQIWNKTDFCLGFSISFLYPNPAFSNGPLKVQNSFTWCVGRHTHQGHNDTRLFLGIPQFHGF